MNQPINRNTLQYFLVYLLYVPIYTLSFLYGRYEVEKNYGHQAVMSYNNVGVSCKMKGDFIVEGQLWGLKNKYAVQIKKDIDFPEKEKYTFLENYTKKENILSLTGLFTYSLGLSALGCLIIFTGIGNRIGKLEIFFLMLASLIAFEPVRLIFYGLFNIRILRPENLLSEALHLPSYFIISVLTAIGTIVCLLILKKLYKQNELRNFFIGSIPGALLGYMIWFYCLGPILMPWKS